MRVLCIMRSFSILLLFLCSGISEAKELKNQTQLGVNYMPEFFFDYDFTNKFSKLAYAVGFNYSKNCSNHWDISSSINYSFLSEKKSMIDYRYKRDISYGFPYDSTLSKYGFLSTSNYITTSLIANYIMLNRSLKLTLNTGVAVRFVFGKKDTQIFIHESGEVNSNISSSSYNNKFLFTPRLGLGIEKKINDKASCRIEPTWYLHSWNYRDYSSVVGINFIILLTFKS